MHGPTCIIWANLTTFLLQALGLERQQIALVGFSSGGPN
jgi:hypothetical protein